MIIPLALFLAACTTSRVPVEETPDQYTSNLSGEGPLLELEMVRGEGHNHPLMAIWVEDDEGRFIQTLFIADRSGKGFSGTETVPKDSGSRERSSGLRHFLTGRTVVASRTNTVITSPHR